MQKLFLNFDGSFIEHPLKNPNCSINEAGESTLYPGIKSYVYVNFDKLNSDIIAVYFKSFTKDIIAVLTNGYKPTVSETELAEYLCDFNYNDHIFGFDIEKTLEEAIHERSIYFEFMCETLNSYISVSNKIIDTFNGYIYEFDKDNILVSYTSSTGQNKWSKYFENLNPELLRSMFQYAIDFWGEDIDSINNEVNLQCNSLANIPHALHNPLTPYFSLENGIINFAIINLIINGNGLNIEEFLNLTRDGVSITEITPKTITFKYHLVEFKFMRSGEFVAYNLPAD